MDRRDFLTLSAAAAAFAAVPRAADALTSRLDPLFVAEDPKVRMTYWPSWRHRSVLLDTTYLDPLPVAIEGGPDGADPLDHPACRLAGAVSVGIRECKLPPPHAAYNASTVFMAGALAADVVGAYAHGVALDAPAEPGADAAAAYVAAVCGVAGALFRTDGESGFQSDPMHGPVNFSLEFAVLRDRLLARIPDGAAKSAGVARGARIAEAALRARPRLENALHLDASPQDWREEHCETPAWARERPDLGWVATTPGVGLEPYFVQGWPIVVRMAETPVFAAGDDAAFDLSEEAAALVANLEDSLEATAKWGGHDSAHRPDYFNAVGFLFEDGASGPPTGVSHVLTALIARLDLPIAEAARWQALTWAALHRAGVEVWREKYCENILRPQTAMDRFHPGLWTNGPAIPSPTFPAFPSGHSAFGASGYRVMTRLLAERGIDANTLPMWIAAPDPQRWPRELTRGGERLAIRFSGLDEAISAGGFSRTACGGIHYWADDESGQRQGEAAAALAYRTLLRPKGAPPPRPVAALAPVDAGVLAERWAVEAAERRGRPAPDLAALDPFPNASPAARAALPAKWLASGMRASYT